ncbi:BQ5605_C025g10076 [Microbotryum silenes-dioicae]|uniref:BQ5605_C025g10076 protein n=1 Tax=Microbotryum silenes-dioicae TaxID=796604 RepID=A0A2X0MMH8_9BASI|nr:BQ5605_C025g10076 [Microbotryum silenes-dioicae]
MSGARLTHHLSVRGSRRRPQSSLQVVLRRAPTKTSTATLFAPFTASKVKAVDFLAPSASTLDSIAPPFEGCLADSGIDRDDGYDRCGLRWL